MKTTITALAAAILTLSLTACGGGADRPSADDISKSIQSGKAVGLGTVSDSITPEIADCMAKVLHDSDVSDDTLDALVKGDEGYKGSTDDAEALSGLSTDIAACVTA